MRRRCCERHQTAPSPDKSGMALVRGRFEACTPLTSDCSLKKKSHKGTKIQVLDLPGIIEGAKDGKGRGKQVIAVARSCNLIMIVLDATKPMKHKQIIENELEGFGIRLNKNPPDI